MNAARRETQIPIGALLAAIGAVLLIVSLFVSWYEEVSGFTIFEALDLLLLGLGLLTLLALASAIGLLRTGIASGHALGAGLLALVVVLVQIVNDPPLVAQEVARGADVDKSTGIWLALAGAALMVAGAILASARVAIAVSPRERPAAPPDEEPTIRTEP